MNNAIKINIQRLCCWFPFWKLTASGFESQGRSHLPPGSDRNTSRSFIAGTLLLIVILIISAAVGGSNSSSSTDEGGSPAQLQEAVQVDNIMTHLNALYAVAQAHPSGKNKKNKNKNEMKTHNTTPRLHPKFAFGYV